MSDSCEVMFGWYMRASFSLILLPFRHVEEFGSPGSDFLCTGEDSLHDEPRGRGISHIISENASSNLIAIGLLLAFSEKMFEISDSEVHHPGHTAAFDESCWRDK